MFPKVKVTANDFTSQFKLKYALVSPEKVGDALKGKDPITKFMLGIPEVGDNGLLGQIANSFGLRVSRELYIDHLWWCFYDIKSGELLTQVRDEKESAWRYLVAIEHENDPSNLAPYVRKLLHINVPLKVIFIYPFKEESAGRKYTRSSSLQKAITILCEEALDLQHNEYLLCLGPEKDEPSIDEWAFKRFDPGLKNFTDV